MTKKLSVLERYRRWLMRGIRSGEIKTDSNFYIIDCDGLSMLVRGDFLPVQYRTSWNELAEYL